MRLSNRLVSAAFIAAMVFPATSSAVVITIGSGSSWSLGSGWAAGCTAAGCDSTQTQLNMDWTIDPGLAGYTNNTLTSVGNYFDVTFGAGTWSEEDNALVSAEIDNLGITGILKLSVPTLADVMNIGITGTATKATLSDNVVDLTVDFAPVTVNFGTTGQLTVDFSTPAWDCNPSQVCVTAISGNGTVTPGAETQTVTARFTLTQLDQGGGGGGVPPSQVVPEPGVLLLMGAGLMGLGLARRRKPV